MSSNESTAAFKGWTVTRHEFAKAITFGGRTPLDCDAVLLAADLVEALAFDVRWRAFNR
jgi:hypothetical protein